MWQVRVGDGNRYRMKNRCVCVCVCVCFQKHEHDARTDRPPRGSPSCPISRARPSARCERQCVQHTLEPNTETVVHCCCLSTHLPKSRQHSFLIHYIHYTPSQTRISERGGPLSTSSFDTATQGDGRHFRDSETGTEGGTPVGCTARRLGSHSTQQVRH